MGEEGVVRRVGIKKKIALDTKATKLNKEIRGKT
jgi:hypothetical protein